MPEDFLSSWRSRYLTPDPTPPAGGSGDFLSSWRQRYQAPEVEEPETWERRGIFEVNSRTGEKRLADKPGALPTAEIDRVHPNLPDGRPLDIGAAGRLAGRTALDSIPGLARLGTSIAGFMQAEPDPQPTLGSALTETARGVLRWNPVTGTLPVAAKVWEKLGITDLAKANERKIEEESDRLLGSGDNPTTAALADYGARIVGNFADPTNLIPAKPAQAALMAAAKRGDREALEQIAKMAVKDAPAPAAPVAAAFAGDKPISQMSREELLELAGKSEITELPNKRSFADAQATAPKPVVVASDVDSLKWLNDTFGHEAGDELLRRKGQAFKDLGIDGYHLSGDEFAARFDTPEEAGEKMDALRSYLAERPMVLVGKDGQQVKVRVDFSHGLGSDLKTADESLGLSKVARTAERRRGARGEAPPDESLGVLPQVPGRRGLQVPEIRGSGAPQEVILQRFEEPGSPVADFSKPHGVYASPVGVDSPHADLGGTRSLWRVNPEAKLLDLSESTSISLRRGATDSGVGVHAARKFLPSEAFERLASPQSTKADAVAVGKSISPSTDWERYTDKQEVIEGIGGLLAKENGYDAILRNDLEDPAFSEHALLTEKAASRLPVNSDASPEILGRESTAYLSDNSPVRFRYVLRDADSVETSHNDAFGVNPRYPHKSGAQPRDLTDPAERLKIEDIKQKYNPARVGPSSSVAGDGAAFIARQTEGLPFTVVGNGRTIAQREALKDPANLAAQLDALKAQGPEAGFPDGFLEEAARLGMKKPAAFRELVGNFDPAALGRDGNVGSTGRMSDLAIAQSDAGRMSPELLSIIDGELPIEAASNRDFVKGFMGEVVPQVEHASMVGRAGELTPAGQRRIRNALLSAAYQNSDAVGKMVESDGEGIRNVGRGMLSAAARLAKQGQLAKAGVRYARDVGPDVAQAANKLSELRASGMPVEMYLRNGELYGRELTDEGRFLLEQFDTLKRDSSAVGGVLRRYTELVDSYGDPNQPTLFSPSVEAPTKLELLQEAVATWKQAEQPLLFPGGSAGVMSSLADSLPGPLRLFVDPVYARKIAETGKKFVTRWLTNFGDVAALGDMAPAFAEKTRLSVAQRTAQEAKAATNLRDFDDALKTFMGSLREAGVARTEEDVLLEALDGMSGKSAMDGFSPALRAASIAMREHVDELTGGILENVQMSKDLRLTLENNLGEYLRKTYEIHRDPEGWQEIVKVVEPWRWENAKRWAAEANPEFNEEQVEGYLNAFFQKNPNAATELAPRSDVFRIDKGIFKHRQQQHLVHMEGGPTRSYATKESAEKAAEKSRGAGRVVTVENVDGMPEPLEQFLGLHMDPRARYSESVSKMAHDIASAKLMRGLRGAGEGTIFHTQPTGEFASSIGGDPAFDPLAGMFTSPEIKAVVESIGRSAAIAAPWIQKLAAVNALVRTGKTVGSPQTHVRNLLSWVPMLVANGHFSSVVNLPAWGGAAKTLIGGSKLTLEGRTHRALESLANSLETAGGKKLGSVFRWDIPALREDLQLAIRLGIVREGARTNEMARYLGLVAETRIGKAAQKMHGVERLIESATKPGGLIRDLYGAEDDLGKLVAWRLERANYQWAFPEMSADEIAELTAPMVRDLYPTYTKAVPAVGAVRDFPFVGDFPTFWAEIGRTTKNVLKQGVKEIRSSNPRLRLVGAKRLAGFGTAIGAPVGVAMAFSGRTGVSEKERAAVAEFVPEWNRYSDLIPVEKKGPGKYSLIDASYVNPYAQGREAWTALMSNGFEWDERVEAAFGEAFAPFMNEGIVAGTIADLARNHTEDGRQVYPEHGTRQEKISAMSAHVARRLEPGVVGLSRDVVAGVTGEENPKTGRMVDLEKLAYSFFSGVRPLEVDVPKKLGFQGRDMQNTRRDIVGSYNRIKNRKGSSPSEKLDAKVSANDAWRRTIDGMRRKVDAARETGLSEFQIRRVLEDEAEISEETIGALLRGTYFDVVK